MTARDILADLLGRGCQVWAVGNSLKLEAPSGLLTDGQLANVRRCKSELIELVSARDAALREQFAFAATETSRRLDEGLCADCGTRLTTSSKSPLFLWCPACRFFWSETDLSQIRASIARHQRRAINANQNERTEARRAA